MFEIFGVFLVIVVVLVVAFIGAAIDLWPLTLGAAVILAAYFFVRDRVRKGNIRRYGKPNPSIAYRLGRRSARKRREENSGSRNPD